MKKVLLAGLAMSALALGAPSAHASDQDWVGGCSFASVTDAVAGQGQQTGEIDIEAIVYSPTATENPVSATFTCYITVNGAEQPGATVSASGTGVIVGAGVITYTSANALDDVQLCQTVVFVNGPTYSECQQATSVEIPPQVVWDTIRAVEEEIDKVICPVLATLTPGVPGVVDINAEGDIWIAAEPFWDCPPYNMVWG